MAKNQIQDGDVLTLPAPADILAGEVVIVGGFAGVAAYSAKSGEPVEVNLRGVFALPKTAGVALAAGATAFYDTTNKKIAGSGTIIGLVAKEVGGAEAFVRVKLSGASGQVAIAADAPATTTKAAAK